MNSFDSNANRLTAVDIALPLDLQDGSANGGLDAAHVYAETQLAVLGETADLLLPASLADVAAHPARLRMKWSGPVLAGQRGLSAACAVRTGVVGIAELAACGQ